MPVRECDCKEFQDSGHTDECNKHYEIIPEGEMVPYHIWQEAYRVPPVSGHYEPPLTREQVREIVRQELRDRGDSQ